MFKNYLELTKAESVKLNDFINKNTEDKLSLEEMDKQLRAEIYDFGKGAISMLDGEEILGKIFVILKECSKKGIAYIIGLTIGEGTADRKAAAVALIEEAKRVAKLYQAKEIYLGTKDDFNIAVLNGLNLYPQYHSIKMTLEDRQIRYVPLKLVALSEQNKKEYLTVYNDAFKDVPNGETLEEKDIEEYISHADDSKNYYLVEAENEWIGFIQLESENGIGQFDLGLIKTARGKGYGRQLLETAIYFLNAKGVTEINLIVMSSNILAYEMYKKRGFREVKTNNYWFSLHN